MDSMPNDQVENIVPKQQLTVDQLDIEILPIIYEIIRRFVSFLRALNIIAF